MSSYTASIILDSSSGPIENAETLMKLSTQEVTHNYYSGYQLALDLIKQKHEKMGYGSMLGSAESIDLAQSVFGCERLVQLIQTEKFDQQIYRRVISEEVDRLSKELFPDVGKRRFVSLDKLHDAYHVEFEQAEEPAAVDTQSQIEILDYLKNKLTAERFEYLQQIFQAQKTTDREFVWNDKIYRLIDLSLEYLETKIDQMSRLYPDGVPFLQEQIDVRQSLSDDEIVGCYKNVYLGIYNKFPMNFLSHDTLNRCSVLTCFAVETILQKKPLDVLKEKTCSELSQIGLTGVVRHFNYSLNRVIRNAYPKILMPWEMAHVEDGFWNDENNRRLAIQWLIEEKLGIAKADIPIALRNDKVTKKTFVENGLSYMFVQHYKSVSRCIGFAYPELMPWELGSVPNSFWHGDEGKRNIIRAVRWMVRQLNISPFAIPEKIKDKTITRETFSRFGLATVFERMYKKNMYHIFNTAYPDHFEFWEIGKVPAEHWDNMLNAYRASLWVSRKEGFDEKVLKQAIDSRALRKEAFTKYGLAGMLKKCFDNDLTKAFLPYILPNRKDSESLMQDVLLLYILEKQVRTVRSGNMPVRVLQRIFLRPLLTSFEKGQLRVYDRIRKRIKRRIGELSLKVAGR
ncbi:hypothetical protein F9K33_14990 [bacterium]|nr:MAG: hypothetical protein F9K33_14990 [bacterium]